MAKPRRKAKSLKDIGRRAPFRSEPDRVLIVTEGTKTEPYYFHKLIRELGLTTAEIRIVGYGGSAPVSVAEKAESILRKDDDFQQIYCVFDRDRHKDYDRALEIVHGIDKKFGKKKTVLAISSIPCFELWYLLHVSDARKPYENPGSPADALIADLKKKAPFERYDKSDRHDFFEPIAANRNEAVQRAERFIKQARHEGASEFHENPSTRVYLIVKALTAIADRKKTENQEVGIVTRT